jgi:hypothetical protein
MMPSQDNQSLAILDSHLYNLRNKANRRLEVLEQAGCFFCGKLEAPLIQQYLCNFILRIPVCLECDAKGYEPQPEDYERHG